MIKGEACALISQHFSLLKQLAELYTHSVCLPATAIMHEVVSCVSAHASPSGAGCGGQDRSDQFLAKFPSSLSKSVKPQISYGSKDYLTRFSCGKFLCSTQLSSAMFNFSKVTFDLAKF